MNILTSKIRPVLLHGVSSFSEIFNKYAEKGETDLIRISTGFISVDSIIFLLENIKRDTISSVQLIIGMHQFTGITRKQYEAVTTLNNELKRQKRGEVFICTAFPYHGKSFLFIKNNLPKGAIVGSSNLDSVLGDDHLEFELDYLINDKEELKKIMNLHDDLINKASCHFDEWQPNTFVTQGLFPVDMDGVEKLVPNETQDFWAKEATEKYYIELKPEPKSNLNCTFGKGRENKKTNIVRPRTWYEVELIASVSEAKKPGYPQKGNDFFVVTNDGYRFICNTQGDYSKNFRSKNKLEILGMWIKGQMEEAGALKVGEPVTREVITKFGKRFMEISATDEPNLWLIKLVKDAK